MKEILASNQRQSLLQFIRTTLFQSHETIDHPLAIIYAVDIHSADCTAAALDLLRPHLQPRTDDPSIPPAMAHAAVLPFWDPEFPRHFVLVADACRGALPSEQIKSKAESLIKAVNSAIPGASTPRVSVLTLNSGSGSEDEAGAAVEWATHMYSTLPSRVENADSVVPSAGEPLERPSIQGDTVARGCWLSARNLDDTRTLISTIIRAFSVFLLLSGLKIALHSQSVQCTAPFTHVQLQVAFPALPCHV